MKTYYLGRVKISQNETVKSISEWNGRDGELYSTSECEIHTHNLIFVDGVSFNKRYDSDGDPVWFNETKIPTIIVGTRSWENVLVTSRAPKVDYEFYFFVENGVITFPNGKGDGYMEMAEKILANI